MKRTLWFCFALLSGVAWSHEVKLEISQQDASVVRLTYADGHPFAFEAYEIYAPGKEMPEQVGRTNLQGQLIFLSGTQTEWRLKAYSADGHGVDQVIKVTASALEKSPSSSTQLPRELLLASGLGIVFGLFGIVQLFIRKKSS